MNTTKDLPSGMDLIHAIDAVSKYLHRRVSTQSGDFQGYLQGYSARDFNGAASLLFLLVLDEVGHEALRRGAMTGAEFTDLSDAIRREVWKIKKPRTRKAA